MGVKMTLYVLVFSNGKSTTIDDNALEWIRTHGAKGVLRIVKIIDENGDDILERDPELKNKLFR